MKTYSATLNNRDCIFDSGLFETAESAVKWASGRGGSYVLQIGTDDSPGISFSTYNGKKWARYTPWDGWKDLTKSEVIAMIESL